MGGTDLTASLVDSLAWPVVALIAVIALRDKIRDLAEKVTDLIPFTKSAKVAGAEIEFAERKAEQLAEVAPVPPQAEPGSAPIDRQRSSIRSAIVRSVGVRSGNTMVAAVGVNLETSLRLAYGRVFPDEGPMFAEPKEMVEKLGDRIHTTYVKELLGMIEMVAEQFGKPDFDPSSDTVDGYTRNSEIMIAALDRIAVGASDRESEPAALTTF